MSVSFIQYLMIGKMKMSQAATNYSYQQKSRIVIEGMLTAQDVPNINSLEYPRRVERVSTNLAGSVEEAEHRAIHRKLLTLSAVDRQNLEFSLPLQDHCPAHL